MKKLVSLVLAAMLLLMNVAALAEVPEGYPEVNEKYVQTEKKTITIYDYWSGDGARKEDPTEEEQLDYDYRDWIESTYNVKVEQVQGGDWGSCAEEMINFCGTPDGSLRAYIIEPGKVLGLVNGGYAAPIKYDMTGEKWNKGNIDLWSKNGTNYGFSTGCNEPRAVLYFNKRILNDAGIQWETIYDMQAEGTWTWETFEDMLKVIQKDVDNDGIVDIWGMTGDNNDLFNMSVATAGGAYFAKDADGKLQPVMGSEQTLEGLNWGRRIWQTYFYQCPDGGSWDYYKEAFKTGISGFYMYQCYGGFNDNSEMADMEDEWGCVAFPVKTAGDPYLTTVSENTYLVPSVYDEDTVDLIMFFVDLYTNDTPGTDPETRWIGKKYNYTDERAVDETYAMLRKQSSGWVNLVVLLGTSNDVLGNSLLWSMGGSTPAELVDAGMPAWQALCDTYNNAK